MMIEPAQLTRPIFLLFSACLGALYLALPALTRPGLFFAVTVDPAFRKTAGGRGIVRGYRTVVLLATMAVLAAIWLLDPVVHDLAIVWSLVGLPVVATLAFLWARSRVLPHAVPGPSSREAAVVSRKLTLPGGLPGQAGPFLLLLGVGGWLATRWERIPKSFPVHWNVAGVADAVASKNVATVFGPLLTSVLTCLFLLAVAVAILVWTRRIAASGAASAREDRFRHVILLVILGAEYLVAVTFALVASRPLLGVSARRWTLGLVLVVTAGFVVVTVAALVRLGQGGSRLHAGTPQAEAMAVAADGTEDRYWKLGLLYVNPADPALFVEKRFGLGYTLNFGNRWAWLILALIFLPLAGALGVAMFSR